MANGSHILPSSAKTGNRRCLRTILAIVAAVAALIIGSLPATVAQQASTQRAAGLTDSISIRGIVLDAANKPIADASVLLEQRDSPGSLTTKTNTEGAFVFPTLHAGSYALSAEKSGQRSRVAIIAVSGGDRKHIDLVLETSPSASAKPMEFADQPNFVVAGITDWTAVGGHGSDSSLRTSEALARETLTLKPEAPGNTEHDKEYDQALASEEAGNYSAAREHVERILVHHDTADLHRLLGDLDEKLGDPLAAVHEYEQAARLVPSEQNYFAWGSELLLHRAVWQAQEVFEKGTEAHPKSARMLTGLGTALFASGLYDQAALRLCDASDLNPADPGPYIFLGKIEMAAPRPLACVEQKLARFVKEQPDSALANYYYAMAARKRNETGETHPVSQQVEILLTKAVTIDPKCSDAYLQLGILHFDQRDMQKAIDFYTKAIETNPQLGEAYYRLGVAYDRLGESAKAKEEFQLHDEIEKRQASDVERQRREVKQFLVVLQGEPTTPPAH